MAGRANRIISLLWNAIRTIQFAVWRSAPIEQPVLLVRAAVWWPLDQLHVRRLDVSCHGVTCYKEFAHDNSYYELKEDTLIILFIPVRTELLRLRDSPGSRKS
jgi:hypothetical protein